MAIYNVCDEKVIFVGKPADALKKYEKIEWEK